MGKFYLAVGLVLLHMGGTISTEAMLLLFWLGCHCINEYRSEKARRQELKLLHEDMRIQRVSRRARVIYDIEKEEAYVYPVKEGENAIYRSEDYPED